jgi:alpha-ribazole phosphatase
MPEVILVRHAETDMSGRFCGQSDPAINEAGRSQLPPLLKELRSWKMDFVYASDLQRAKQTAGAIAQEFLLPLEFRTGLREICFGEWEGLLWGEIELRDPKAAELWIRGYPYGIVPGGEEYARFVSRVDAEAKFLSEKARESGIVVVTHAGVIREILLQQCGVSSEVSWSWTKEYGKFVVIDSGDIVHISANV